MNLHGARPWHPSSFFRFFVAGEREVPRDKPVASSTFEAKQFDRKSVNHKTHGHVPKESFVTLAITESAWYVRRT